MLEVGIVVVSCSIDDLEDSLGMQTDQPDHVRDLVLTICHELGDR